MTDPSIEACVKYESTLDVTTMELAKIEIVTAADRIRSKKTPVFSAKHGVEGLFHVIDRFIKNGEKIGYAIGAIISGITADIFGIDYAILLIGTITILSSLVIKIRMPKNKAT